MGPKEASRMKEQTRPLLARRREAVSPNRAQVIRSCHLSGRSLQHQLQVRALDEEQRVENLVRFRQPRP